MSVFNSNYSDEFVINKIKNFLEKFNLDSKLSGICILTVGVDRSSLCGCLCLIMIKKYY